MEQIAPCLSDPRFNEINAARLQSDIERLFLSQTTGIGSRNFNRIATADLRLLFNLYDDLFFAGSISRCLKANSVSLSFRLAPRLTSAGGKTTYYPLPRNASGQRPIEIAISTTLLFESFHGPDPEHIVVGCPCRDRTEALLRIFEHELLHLIEINDTGTSRCSAPPFKRMARRIFGHRESNHQLIRPADRARRQCGIVVGDSVWFEFEGVTIRGTVNRITKRATVLVPAAQGILYNDGRRYAKYYVPIHQLRSEKTTVRQDRNRE